MIRKELKLASWTKDGPVRFYGKIAYLRIWHGKELSQDDVTDLLPNTTVTKDTCATKIGIDLDISTLTCTNCTNGTFGNGVIGTCQECSLGSKLEKDGEGCKPRCSKSRLIFDTKLKRCLPCKNCEACVSDHGWWFSLFKSDKDLKDACHPNDKSYKCVEEGLDPKYGTEHSFEACTECRDGYYNLQGSCSKCTSSFFHQDLSLIIALVVLTALSVLSRIRIERVLILFQVRTTKWQTEKVVTSLFLSNLLVAAHCRCYTSSNGRLRSLGVGFEC